MSRNGTQSSPSQCQCMLDEPPSSGFHATDPGKWGKWTVKLMFDRPSSNGICGTGFYLNVPDTDSYVILTAGHNLINEDKTRTKNLRIEIGDEQCIAISEDNVFICQDYKESPKHNKEDDWGMILMPKFKGSPPLGFGFSLLFATEGAFLSEPEMCLTIGGYPESDGFNICSGKGQKNGEKQLVYSIVTKHGMSGAPVFLAHKGVETVVGIHTRIVQNSHIPTTNGPKAAGCRLSLRVLQQVFDWAKVSQRRQALKAAGPSAPSGGLYLTFLHCAGYGFSLLGKSFKGTYTEFDIIPAETRPAVGHFAKTKYAFSITRNQRGQHLWLHWDAQSGQVTLTDRICSSCFITVCRDEKDSSQFRLIATNASNKCNQLSMAMEGRSIENLDVGLATAQLLFEKQSENAKKFNRFQFESRNTENYNEAHRCLFCLFLGSIDPNGITSTNYKCCSALAY